MGSTTLDLEPAAAEAIVQAVLTRHLITEAEVDAARAAAEQAGKSVVAVLVEDGLIAQRSIDGIAASLASSAAAVDSGVTRATGPAPSAGRPPSGAPVVPGYELVSKLGEGGMGAVWLARQVKVGNREVALKVISAAAVDDEARARFQREGEAAARINHENVIRIIELGDTPDGRPFMALELVPGGDAQKLCEQRGGRLGEAEALALVRDAACGVGELASKGLVHRDIKPANIFMGADGRAKLGDLGLARQAKGDDRMTASGMIVGTPAFMSPEQASAQPLDVRTDIYALGATLYALVTGRPPFVGRTALVVVAKVLNEEAPDPRDLAPALSAGTARAIARCLAKDPRERFQTANELVEALQRALAATSGRVPREVPPPRPSGRVITAPRRDEQTRPLPHSALQSTPRSVAPLALGGALVLGVLGGAFSFLGGATPPTPGPTAQARSPKVTPAQSTPVAPHEPAAPSELKSPGVEDTWVPPALTPARTSPRTGRATELPRSAQRTTGFRQQPLAALPPTQGRAFTDGLGRVNGQNTQYLLGNSAPFQATTGAALLQLQRAPDAVWWSVRATPATFEHPLTALGDWTGTHAFAAQVRLQGSSGKLLVWLLDPARKTHRSDFGLDLETPAVEVELQDVKRWSGANLQLYFSVAGGAWAVSLCQGDRCLAYEEGDLPAGALTGELRLFSAVCAHGWRKQGDPLLEAGLAFETR